MGHGKVWKRGTAIMPGFGATRKTGRAEKGWVLWEPLQRRTANGAAMPYA
jgi:hypothetical protein